MFFVCQIIYIKSARWQGPAIQMLPTVNMNNSLVHETSEPIKIVPTLHLYIAESHQLNGCDSVGCVGNVSY